MGTSTLGIGHLKFCIYYNNELVQELLDNTSIFYYDAQLGVNVIMFEPFPYIPKFNSFLHFLIYSILMANLEWIS